MAAVNLVVSCAKRKTREPRASLRLRAVHPELAARPRAAAWASRLAAQSAGDQATDLYAGEHWQVVRSVAAQSLSVRVWVVSAGYGLVRLDTPLAPYSATFAAGQPDSVCVAGGAAARAALPEWWAAIADALAPHPGPRTLAAVARAHPEDFLLVALSTAYLAAVAPDLADAVPALAAPEWLAILSAGGRVPDTLAPFLLPARGGLVGQAGGTMSALNARLARQLIQESGPEPLTYSRCRAAVEVWSRQAPPPRPARRRATDEEVGEFIRREQDQAGSASPTALLRRLRAAGGACSQARFDSLFRQTGGGRRAHG